MKLIYITSKKFPSKKVDPFYVRSMAEAFTELLGEDFLFFIRGDIPNELKNMPVASVKFPQHFRTMYYFFWMPILIMTRAWNDREVIFLSYDPYLLSILIFWRKIFRFKYSICSDWHQLFDDWRLRCHSLHLWARINSCSAWTARKGRRARALPVPACPMPRRKPATASV